MEWTHKNVMNETFLIRCLSLDCNLLYNLFQTISSQDYWLTFSTLLANLAADK